MNGYQKLSVIFFFVLLLLPGRFYGQENDISEVKFTFWHSLRIAYRHVSITFQSTGDNVKVHVISESIFHSKDRDKAKQDDSFFIGKRTFNKIIHSIYSINSADIEKQKDFNGKDGSTCEITFGNKGTATTYSVWTPDYDTKQRSLQAFLSTCKLILKTAKLKPNEIL